MRGVFIIDETHRLLHVYKSCKEIMQKHISQIKLTEIPFFDHDNSEDKVDVNKFDYGRESFVEVKTIYLVEIFRNQPNLEVFHCAIGMELHIVDPVVVE